ncbi:AraC family transcriptional regulator [Mesorhizobium sp. B2-8-3]|uniref:helix-turn-helix domain-containing protein n=1 Tax=Mesorhizobium sp. B2-8-3 TaxID=2589905 RepID=UPI001128F254|nr:AraC family transcriptional regulator [Mesorhizobium sp. B2-8-3]TPJ27415.1 helix-turn-helix domain-containing protein [Mesorhizobium sp. B2-8-3]
MKPYLEKVTIADDASWSMVRVPRDPTIPFEWHHHPEYELTLTLNSRGRRFVGDHVGNYDDGDLVLLGPNLPHTWSSSGKIDVGRPHLVMVIWFRPEWARGLTGLLTELRPVAGLLERSARGLKFSQGATGRVRARIEAIFDKPPAERLLDLISVLLTLAGDDEAEPLTAPSRSPSPIASSGSRIDRVLDYLHAHYTDDLSIDRLARLAALSPSGFHRMFTRHTRLTLVEYVTRLRIGEACALLTEEDKPIAYIAELVGYRSLANFGRQFKALKGLTPREYRGRFAS